MARDSARAAALEFAQRLRDLRAQAGDPSFRAMAGLSGAISHTTLHDAVRGDRLPSWPTVREFVRVCGGEPARWEALWQHAYDRVAAQPLAAPARRPAAGTPAEPPSALAQALPPPAEPVSAPGGPVPSRGAALRIASGSRISRPPRRLGGSRTRRRLGLLLAAACATGGLCAVFAFDGAPARGAQAASVATSPSMGLASGPLVPGDASAFVADITIPDGTVVVAGQRFMKTWELQNTGTVEWKGRFLARAALPQDRGACATPALVHIPDTPPGGTVEISVPVVAPAEPGTCWVGWKMVDTGGRYCFSGLRPVYFLVSVVAPAGDATGRASAPDAATGG